MTPHLEKKASRIEGYGLWTCQAAIAKDTVFAKCNGPMLKEAEPGTTFQARVADVGWLQFLDDDVT
eukprot:1403310-Rhodomonas_salina.1